MMLMLGAFYGCAGMGGPSADASYIGTAKGKYASVHYRVEDENLVIAFENISTVHMKNLIISVDQKTTAGSANTSTTASLLRIRTVRHITLKIPHNATGDVQVRYYFFASQAAPIPMSPYHNHEPEASEPFDDLVSFKIFIK